MPKEDVYNDLHERAKNGEIFTNLMPLVLSGENILLAYGISRIIQKVKPLGQIN